MTPPSPLSLIDTGLGEILEKKEINLDIIYPPEFGTSTNNGSENLEIIHKLLGQSLSQKPFFLVSGPNVCHEVVNTPMEFKQNESFSSATVVPNDNSFMGSPLKLNTIANLSSERSPQVVCNYSLKRFSPVTLKYARKLLNKFIAIKISKVPEISTLIVLCDAKDSKKTHFIGAHKEIKNGKLWMKLFNVISKKINASLLEEYFQEEEKLSYKVVSNYQILDKRDGLGNLVLQVQWFDHVGQAKLTKFQAAEYYLQATVTPGSDQSPVFDLFCQLRKIQGFVESAKTGERMEESPLTEANLVSLLGELLQKARAGNLGQQRVVKEKQQAIAQTGMLSGTARLISLDTGYESDFTDELWAIICLTSDYTEIVKCLNLIFCALRRGGIKAFIRKDNETTLAKLVRQSYSGIASFPSLLGKLPLQLVAEIGVEKMRKHYQSIFINNRLCTSEQWSSFFDALTPTFDEVMNFEELSLSLLSSLYDVICKLHHCLEIVSLIDAMTENQPLATFTQTIMNYYKNEQLDLSHNFSFPITALQAAPEIKRVPLSSLRREHIAEGVSRVEFLTSDFPEDLNVSMPSSCSDMSIDAGISKELVVFKTEEALHCF